MRPAFTAAFVVYALSVLLFCVFGIFYLVRSQFMPYHQEAVGKPWHQLDSRLQALLIGLMRTAGGGLLATGVAIAILLLTPFRAGEPWAKYAIPVIGLVGAIPSLYATMMVRSRTQAHSPVAASAAGVGLLVLGFVLSLL
ncbi:MAG: hypothetical protein JXB07_14540 [Anaerolineae bacterium]|nr:hypothetical protein [Anaerolineae bacterium]